MTVKELIEKLQTCPQDARVYYYDSEYGATEAETFYDNIISFYDNIVSYVTETSAIAYTHPESWLRPGTYKVVERVNAVWLGKAER